MRRSGTIAAIDNEQGAAAIATPDRGYTIIELEPGWEVSLGDRIEWDNDDGLGFETYINVTRGTTGEVFVENHDVNEHALRLQFS
jgi:hypothetical protein